MNLKNRVTRSSNHGDTKSVSRGWRQPSSMIQVPPARRRLWHNAIVACFDKHWKQNIPSMAGCILACRRKRVSSTTTFISPFSPTSSISFQVLPPETDLLRCVFVPCNINISVLWLKLRAKNDICVAFESIKRSQGGGKKKFRKERPLLTQTVFVRDGCKFVLLSFFTCEFVLLKCYTLCVL